MNDTWNKLPSDDIIEKTIAALQKNNIAAEAVNTSEEAKEKVISMIPKGAEVMNMTSVTLDQISLSKEITESGNYRSVRNELTKMNRETQGLEMQKLGAAPEWAVGSVHAVTEDGKVLIASNTGSQIPAYVYGSPHVIWVVSTKKIVPTFDAGFKRIYDHVLPQESVRARKAYGLPDTFNSFVSKLLIVNREVTPGRITLIFVKEDLGF